MKLKKLINRLTPLDNLRLWIFDNEGACYFSEWFFDKKDVKGIDAWNEIKDLKVTDIKAGSSEKYGAKMTIYIDKGKGDGCQ